MNSINQITFRRLFDEYFEPMCCYLSYYTVNRSIIEEVVQDVFVKLWEERDSLQIESLKTYLYTSARNRVYNYMRNEKRHHTLIEDWAANECEKEKGEDCFDIDEFTQRIDTAIEQLPDKCKLIFTLSKKDQLTYKQIAERLGISIKTVENQMVISLRKIREYLSNYYPKVKKILFLSIFRKITNIYFNLSQIEWFTVKSPKIP